MRPFIFLLISSLCLFYSADGQELINSESPHNFDETTNRLKKNIESAGLNIIANIDHSGAAAKNGLDLAPSQLFIFGNPKVGTLLMQEDSKAGLDLPLKILVWAKEGKTFLTYRDPSFLNRDYTIRNNKGIVENMQRALKKIIEQTIQK